MKSIVTCIIQLLIEITINLLLTNVHKQCVTGSLFFGLIIPHDLRVNLKKGGEGYFHPAPQESMHHFLFLLRFVFVHFQHCHEGFLSYFLIHKGLRVPQEV